MYTYIYVILAMVINFYNPASSQNKTSIKNNSTQNKIIRGFPYQYFEGEVLTDEMVNGRILGIYMSVLLIYATANFSGSPTLAPIVEQTIFTSTSIHRKRLIPNKIDFQTNRQELRLNVRGGANDDLTIFMMIWLYKMNHMPTEALSTPVPNTPSFTWITGLGLTLNNPGPLVGPRNNPRLGPGKSKKGSPSLLKRFPIKNYTIDEFLDRATNPLSGKVDLQQLDEAVSMYQVKHEQLFLNPSRPGSKKKAQAVYLDFTVEERKPVLKELEPNFDKITYVDIKTSVGSDVLGRGNPPRTLTDMAYSIERKFVLQKH